jgi:hypothetical protein
MSVTTVSRIIAALFSRPHGGSPVGYGGHLHDPGARPGAEAGSQGGRLTGGRLPERRSGGGYRPLIGRLGDTLALGHIHRPEQ